MNKNDFHISHVGSASILLIFTVLSLVSFAVLSLSSASADYRLSENLAKRQLMYYEACHRGNAFVAAVNSGYSEGETNGIIEKSIPFTDNQTLDIAITAGTSGHAAEGEMVCTVTKWKVVSHADYDYDTPLPVMK